jgi:hypothetical protein
MMNIESPVLSPPEDQNLEFGEREEDRRAGGHDALRLRLGRRRTGRENFEAGIHDASMERLDGDASL